MGATGFGIAVLSLALVTWRYSRPIASWVARGPMLRPLGERDVDAAARGVRFFSGMLFVIFAAWCFVRLL